MAGWTSPDRNLIIWDGKIQAKEIDATTNYLISIPTKRVLLSDGTKISSNGNLLYDGNTLYVSGAAVTGKSGMEVIGFDNGGGTTGIILVKNQYNQPLVNFTGDASYWRAGNVYVYGNTDSADADMGVFNFNNNALSGDKRVGIISCKRGSSQGYAGIHFMTHGPIGWNDCIFCTENGDVVINNGATNTFTSADGKNITVTNGVVTSIA